MARKLGNQRDFNVVRHLAPVRFEPKVRYDKMDVPYSSRHRLSEGFQNAKQGARGSKSVGTKTKGRVGSKGSYLIF